MLRLDSDRTIFRVSDLPVSPHLPILNYSVCRLQKRTSPLRPHRRNTWNWHKIHLDWSPEELDGSGQTEGWLNKTARAVGGIRPSGLSSLTLHVSASWLSVFDIYFINFGFFPVLFRKNRNRNQTISIFVFNFSLPKSYILISNSRHRSTGKWSTRCQERFGVSLVRWFTRFVADFTVGGRGFCRNSAYFWGRVSYLLPTVLFCIYFSSVHILVYCFLYLILYKNTASFLFSIKNLYNYPNIMGFNNMNFNWRYCCIFCIDFIRIFTWIGNKEILGAKW